jgi:hypothetical protein
VVSGITFHRTTLLTYSHSKTPGIVGGFIFRPLWPRPVRVTFASNVPHGEGFDNPRYLNLDQRFSKKIKRSCIHECTVAVGRNLFLVSAYWEGSDDPNMAVEAACPGLEWRGEIAIVQAGRFVTFYKNVKSLSVASKSVAR